MDDLGNALQKRAQEIHRAKPEISWLEAYRLADKEALKKTTNGGDHGRNH